MSTFFPSSLLSIARFSSWCRQNWTKACSQTKNILACWHWKFNRKIRNTRLPCFSLLSFVVSWCFILLDLDTDDNYQSHHPNHTITTTIPQYRNMRHNHKMGMKVRMNRLKLKVTNTEQLYDICLKDVCLRGQMPEAVLLLISGGSSSSYPMSSNELSWVFNLRCGPELTINRSDTMVACTDISWCASVWFYECLINEFTMRWDVNPQFSINACLSLAKQQQNGMICLRLSHFLPKKTNWNSFTFLCSHLISHTFFYLSTLFSSQFSHSFIHSLNVQSFPNLINFFFTCTFFTILDSKK